MLKTLRGSLERLSIKEREKEERGRRKREREARQQSSRKLRHLECCNGHRSGTRPGKAGVSRWRMGQRPALVGVKCHVMVHNTLEIEEKYFGDFYRFSGGGNIHP